MLKGFGNFLLKELKELVRDPKILLGMIIVPLLMFPVLGGIMSYSIQSAQEKAEQATVLVVNNDGGNWSTSLIAFLNSSARVSVENNKVLDNDTILELLTKYNTTYLVEIPDNFTLKMNEHQSNPNITAYVRFYGAFSGTSLFENIGSSVIDNLIYQFNRHWAPDSVAINKSTIIKGNVVEGVDPNTLTTLMYSQAIAMPITIMILLTYSMQIAATSVAMEKKRKH